MRAILLASTALVGVLHGCENRPPQTPAPTTLTVAPLAPAALPPTVVTEANVPTPECASATDCHPINACGVFSDGDCGPESVPMGAAEKGCPDAEPTYHCDCVEGRCLGVP